MPSVRNGTKIKKRKKEIKIRQKWKKITAFMLVIIMVLGMMPDTTVTVHSEEAAYSRTGCRQL